MTSTTKFTSMDRPIVTAEFLLPSGSHPVSILIDSRVDGNVMDTRPPSGAAAGAVAVTLSTQSLGWAGHGAERK